MFDKEILAIKSEILALKQQKLKSISKLQTTETHIPIDFVLQEVGGDSLGSQTVVVDIWPTNNVKPLLSYYFDISSVSNNRIYNCTKFADFDLPPDFKYHLEFRITLQAYKSAGDYAGLHIQTDFVIVSTSKLSVVVSEE